MLRIHVCSRNIRSEMCNVTMLRDNFMLIVRNCLFFVCLILMLFIGIFVSFFFCRGISCV